MRLPDDSETPYQINIVPMIDVIFSILAFFIISTLYLTRSEGLPVNLPTAATAETQLQEQINVTITADGAIALNRQPIALQNLEGAVRQQIGSNSQSLVVINADTRVAHGVVVSVMDRLRQVEGIKLAIAAESVRPTDRF
jgi:biopolymer transport protein ExbD